VSDRKPLVLDAAGRTQQLQPSDELDIPLEQRVQILERKLTVLVTMLIGEGFDLSDELTNDAE